MDVKRKRAGPRLVTAGFQVNLGPDRVLECEVDCHGKIYLLAERWYESITLAINQIEYEDENEPKQHRGIGLALEIRRWPSGIEVAIIGPLNRPWWPGPPRLRVDISDRVATAVASIGDSAKKGRQDPAAIIPLGTIRLED